MSKNGISTQILQIIDGLLVCLAFWVVSVTRVPIREIFGYGELKGDPFNDLGVVLAVAIPLVPLVLEGTGFYHLRGGIMRSIRIAVSGVAIAALILLTLMIALKTNLSSRYLLLGLPPILILLLSLRSWIVHLYNGKRSQHESRKSSVQIFGSKKEVEEFTDALSPEEKANWDIQKPINLDDVEISNLVGMLQERSVARAIIVSSKTQFDRVSRTVELCESMGVEVMVASDFLRTKLSIPEIEQVGGRTVISLRSTPSVSYSLVAKKLLDRVGAFLLILATSPFWIFAMIGIRLKSPQGSIFFKQQRAGLYGRPFTMWKFRTMHQDAEAQLDQVKQEVGNEMDGPVFKLDKDPRVFAFGDILRRTSIDELPQLLNVVMGEMSLVGPRPLPLYEVEDFQKSEYRRRLSVKPGITCYWQAGGRNSITSFEQWVDLDLKYIDNWSFILDLKILLMTVPAVLFKKGAK